MSPETAHLIEKVIDNAPMILGAITSSVGAIAALFGLAKSNSNARDLKETKSSLSDNTAKTEEVGKAVNGRMTAFLAELERKNGEALAKAVEAAKLEAEKLGLEKITELKVELARIRSDATK